MVQRFERVLISVSFNALNSSSNQARFWKSPPAARREAQPSHGEKDQEAHQRRKDLLRGSRQRRQSPYRQNQAKDERDETVHLAPARLGCCIFDLLKDV